MSVLKANNYVCNEGKTKWLIHLNISWILLYSKSIKWTFTLESAYNMNSNVIHMHMCVFNIEACRLEWQTITTKTNWKKISCVNFHRSVINLLEKYFVGICCISLEKIFNKKHTKESILKEYSSFKIKFLLLITHQCFQT